MRDIWPVRNRSPAIDEEGAHRLLDLRQMAAEAAERLDEMLGEAGDDQEGNAEAERIDGEEAGAARHRIGRAGDREDCRQHRPDAGRPAEGEGEPEHIGAGKARPAAGRRGRRASRCMKRDAEHAEESAGP